jgi:preprotein translocase subunit SecD
LAVVIALVVVLIVVLAVGAVVVLRNVDSTDDSSPTNGPAAAAVEFRRVVKSDPGVCESPAVQGIACDSMGNRYTLGKVELDGSHVTKVKAEAGQADGWYLLLSLDKQGTQLFADLTTALAAKAPPGNQVAIVVRGEVLAAPAVSAPITGGQVQIAGTFSKEEAEKLATDLTR